MTIIVATSPSPSRRSFMKAILALAAAPAIVKVANLMPVREVVAELDFAGLRQGFIGQVWSTELLDQFYRKCAFDRALPPKVIVHPAAGMPSRTLTVPAKSVL